MKHGAGRTARARKLTARKPMRYRQTRLAHVIALAMWIAFPGSLAACQLLGALPRNHVGIDAKAWISLDSERIRSPTQDY